MATESESESAPAQSLHLRRIVAGWKRSWLLVAATLCAIVAAMAFLAPTIPVNFESVAVIELRPDVAAITQGSAGLDSASQSERGIEEARERCARQLLSHDMLQVTAQALLETDAGILSSSGASWSSRLLSSDVPGTKQEQVAAIVEWLRKALKVERIPRSPLANLALRHSDPASAQRTLRLHCDLFQKRSQGSSDVGSLSAAAKEQHGVAVSALENARQTLHEFDKLHAWDGEDCLKLLADRTDRLSEQLAARRSNAEGASARAMNMEQGLASIPMQFSTQPWRGENRHYGYTLDLLAVARERVLKCPFKEGSEELNILMEPVATLQAELLRQQPILELANPDIPNPAHFQLLADVVEARAAAAAGQQEVRVLEAECTALRGRMESLRAVSAQRAALTGSLERAQVVESDKSALLLRVQRVHDMQKSAQLGELPFVESPTFPSRPVRFGRTAQMILLALGGILAGFSFWSLIWLLDGSVRSAADVQLATGSTPVLELTRATGNGIRNTGHAQSSAAVALDSMLLGLKAAEAVHPRILVCSVSGPEDSREVASQLAARLSIGMAQGACPILLDGADALTRHAAIMKSASAGTGEPGTGPLVVDAAGLEQGLPVHELLVSSDAILVAVACDRTSRSALAEASRALAATQHPRIGLVLLRGRRPAAQRSA